MTPSLHVDMRRVFETPETHQTQPHNEFLVLLISSDLEGRRTVNGVLEALSVQVVWSSTVSQAREALEMLRPNMIFCEERLPDGGYVELLELDYQGRISPPLVVLTRTGEWELYIDATRRGAFDVIRSPWCPTDIELSLIRAAREEKNALRATR